MEPIWFDTKDMGLGDKDLGELLGMFGGMVAVFNPMYPLQFERFGDGNLDDDPEFKSHITKLVETQNHEVATELGVDVSYYASAAIFKAEKKARTAYVLKDPIAEAKKALKISPHCPEAYNVFAQFEAKTYDEALGFYNKAVEVAPNVSHKFDKELSEKKCWGLNHLRSYFRAVHGQANTLRKMGRYEESLKKYLELEKLDSKFYSWSSFANWRYHVLEVYMKMGDDKGALKFALKKSNIEAFRVSSSCGAWFWTKALLDYRYKKQTGFAEDYFDVSNSDDPESKNLFNNFEGTILRAFQASPETLRFLTGERKLPNCRVPYHMGNWASLSNVGIYCLSNAELWRNTPGALEWAARNVRTLMCSLILNQDLECCKTLNIKCSTSQFEELLSQGIFLDAKVSNNGRHSGKTLVHVATCNEKPQLLRMLLNAGAEVKTSRIGRGIPPPLHMSCYYNFSPKIIKILCNAGADPTDKCGMHYSPLQMAAEQGAITAFKTAFECLPAHRKKDQGVLDSILLAVFQSSCYECVTGLGNLCQRCLGGDSAHPPDATWTGVLDILMELNYKPAKKYLESMNEFPGKKKLFAYYTSKLRGEEPQVIAEGPSLGRKPLSLMQSSNMSTFLSAMGQFGEPFHSGMALQALQKQIESAKAVIPKSATCENCKGREKKMMVCGQCRQAYYCSRECQKKNWKEHKKSCSP